MHGAVLARVELGQVQLVDVELDAAPGVARVAVLERRLTVDVVQVGDQVLALDHRGLRVADGGHHQGVGVGRLGRRRVVAPVVGVHRRRAAARGRGRDARGGTGRRGHGGRRRGTGLGPLLGGLARLAASGRHEGEQSESGEQRRALVAHVSSRWECPSIRLCCGVIANTII